MADQFYLSYSSRNHTIHTVLFCILFTLSRSSFKYIYLQSYKYMIAIYFLATLLLFLIPQLHAQESIILKTAEYNFSFGKVANLPYPEFIDVQEEANNTVKVSVYNLTSRQLVSQPYTFIKSFVGSTCEYVLQTVDYGYYKKFPFYRVIGECNNLTHVQVLNFKIYRSGDFQLIQGLITQKSADEVNCTMGPLRAQNIYSATTGYGDTYIYRFCMKKLNSTTQSWYKQYLPDSKISYAFKEQSIERVVGNTNLSLLDVIPGLGPGGKFTLYVSQTYGLFLNGGSKFNQSTYKPSGGEKMLRIEKLCWSNTYALLTEGSIYFVNTTFSINGSSYFNELKKVKISVDKPSQCTFFTIGYYAVCSIYSDSDNQTTWYIFGQGTRYISTNATQIFKGKQPLPYISEDLCSSNSFYLEKSRYQFYFKSLKDVETTASKVLKKTELEGVNGDIIDFIDTDMLFIASSKPIDSNRSTLFFSSAYKTSFSTIYSINSITIPKNLSLFKLETENYVSNGAKFVSVIYSGNSLNSTAPITGVYQYIYSPSSQSPFYFTTIPSFANNFSCFDVAYLTKCNSLNIMGPYHLLVKTSIQTNSYARLTYASSVSQLRYPYEFQTHSFKACSLTSPDNQVLFIRKDTDKLVVMRAGLRFHNYLALDSVVEFPQYKGYDVECAHDGIFLSNADANYIHVLDSDLQLKYSQQVAFDRLKFTKSLLILKNGPYVELRSISKGDLIALNRWQLDDIVVNIHSSGFINRNENVYYEFGVNESNDMQREGLNLQSE